MTDRRAPLRRLPAEQLAALAVCTIAALIISWRILRADVYTQDAFVHQYWMWSFRDPQLFNDGLTAELRDSARYPIGYQALFWLGAQVTSPILFGELLGVALMALSGWLVFLIVREHSAWRPAAWIAAALFLALIDIHRFHGGLQRAFVHPVVLLTVLLALRRKDLAAALVAAGGALVYPPAALLAVGALCVSALARDGLRPLLERRRAAYAGLALVLAALFVLAPTLSEAAPRVMSADEARRFAEFGPDGGLHFFVPSVVDYLTQNRSGFDLRATGSILLVAAVAALAAQRGNLRLMRREVLALPVVALGAFAVAQAVLFRLYLPHRYTYPLVAFFAIAVAVSLAPTWDALWARRRRRLLAFAVLCAPAALYVVALYAFPLGPTEPLERLGSWTAAAIAAAVVAGAAAVALLLGRAARFGGPAAGALFTGLALVGTLLIADHSARGSACARRAATPYLAQLPKDAVIAGDPSDLECLPATARRAVVISTQLAPSYETDYFLAGRARMFATLRAYYGRSAGAIAELHTRYGATHLWVRRGAIQAEMSPAGRRWPERRLPYGPFVRELLRGGDPASLRLPAACRRWARGAEEVYEIRCIQARQSARSAIDARADSTNRITRSPASSTSEA